ALFLTFIKNAPHSAIGPHGIRYSQTEHQTWAYWLFWGLLVYPFLKYTHGNPFYVGIAVVIGLTLLFAQRQTGAIGSHWCLYSNLVAILFLFYPKFESMKA